MKPIGQLLPQQSIELISRLKLRFENNMQRHTDIEWANVEQRLVQNPIALKTLFLMDETAGEPDVVGFDKETDKIIFYDCSAESPMGRRGLCYDLKALQARKENKPSGSAIEMASEMEIQMLSEQQYRQLQLLGNFDQKTSSWVLTPPDIRLKGGALFCDWRYGHVFLYHNGAESYYGSRGFRGFLEV